MKWHLLAVGLMTKDSQVLYCCTSCRIRSTCGRRVSFEVYPNNFFIKVMGYTSKEVYPNNFFIKVIDRNKFECACSYSRCFDLDFF